MMAAANAADSPPALCSQIMVNQKLCHSPRARLSHIPDITSRLSAPNAAASHLLQAAHAGAHTLAVLLREVVIGCALATLQPSGQAEISVRGQSRRWSPYR